MVLISSLKTCRWRAVAAVSTGVLVGSAGGGSGVGVPAVSTEAGIWAATDSPGTKAQARMAAGVVLGWMLAAVVAAAVAAAVAAGEAAAVAGAAVSEGASVAAGDSVAVGTSGVSDGLPVGAARVTLAVAANGRGVLAVLATLATLG